MPSLVEKEFATRISRAKEVLGAVRSAMPRVEWSDARCAEFATKLLCLGHRSFELLYDFLFDNAFVSSPSKALYDDVTLPQDISEDVTATQRRFPASFRIILKTPCPCSSTDFSIFIAYVRSNGHKLSELAPSASAATAITTIAAAPAPRASSASCHGASSATDHTSAAGDDTRMRTENVRALDRINYRRRQLRKVADDMDWPGASAFYDLYCGRTAPA
jgi:hypothetical protein